MRSASLISAPLGGGALDRLRHRGVELDLLGEAERHRVDRGDVGDVPVAAVADRLDGRLGGADELGDLPVRELGVELHQPGDGGGTVLALAERGVARPLALPPRPRRRGSSSGAGSPWGRVSQRSVISSAVSWRLAIGSKPLMPCATSPSAIPFTSSSCSPQNSAICRKVRVVFSTNQTAVAFCIRGKRHGPGSFRRTVVFLLRTRLRRGAKVGFRVVSDEEYKGPGAPDDKGRTSLPQARSRRGVSSRAAGSSAAGLPNR